MSIPAGTAPYMVPRRNADGAIDAGTEQIVNLTAGSATGHAVEYDQMNTAIAAVSTPTVDTINAITGDETAVAGLYTLNVIDSASASCAITLPAAAAGKVVRFSVEAYTSVITIAAGAGDALGTNVPAALYLAGETLKLTAKDSTTWLVSC